MNKNCLLTFALLGFNLLAAEFELQNPAYGGSGCEAGSVRLAITPEKDEVFFEMSNYRSVAGERKTCLLVLPIQASPGTRVAIASIYLKNNAQLGQNETAVFQAELFLAGLRGPIMSLMRDGPSTNSEVSFLAPDESKLVWSGCGQSANLRVNTSLNTLGGSMQVFSLGVQLKTGPC